MQAEQEATQAELKAAQKAFQDAKTDAEKQAAQKRLKKATAFPAMMTISMADGPGAAFSRRFLAFAVKHPKNSAALDALNMALITSGGPNGKAGTWSGAVKAFQSDQVKNPELVKWVRLFRQLASAHDDASDLFLREVMAKNPDRKAQGRACVALVQGRTSAAELGERLKADLNYRRNAEKFLGGKDSVDRLIAVRRRRKSRPKNSPRFCASATAMSAPICRLAAPLLRLSARAWTERPSS